MMKLQQQSQYLEWQLVYNYDQAFHTLVKDDHTLLWSNLDQKVFNEEVLLIPTHNFTEQHGKPVQET